MREIDFTPIWYVQTRREREALPFRAGGLLVIGALVAVWSYSATSRTRAAETELASLRVSLGTQKGMASHLQTIEEELAARQRCARLLEDVGGGVRTADLMAELSHLLPSSVGVRALRLTAAPRVPPAASEDRAERKATVNETSPTSLELDGWASSGAAVGALLQRLSGSPLFDDVVLRYQRTTMVDDAVVVEFQIVGTMPKFE